MDYALASTAYSRFDPQNQGVAGADSEFFSGGAVEILSKFCRNPQTVLGVALCFEMQFLSAIVKIRGKQCSRLLRSRINCQAINLTLTIGNVLISEKALEIIISLEI